MRGKAERKTADRGRDEIAGPEDYRVILLNDDYTTMDFVVEILTVIFRKKPDDATKIMMDVHLRGKGIVGQYPWDIACTKADQVHLAARENRFPLRCIVEPAR
ncbi:MAG: ATP-dependent Clp protease adaptor ClpS [Treponema sp.]|nr:ATP-dependent Clp protease adaptor ClpS [Treponema sp.]